MLVKIDKKNKLVFDSELLKLVPVFKKLKQDELLFIAMAYDYDSPYKQFNEEERIKKAWKFTYGQLEIKDLSHLKEAVEEYKACQYDSKRDTIERYQKKIALFLQEMETETVPNKVSQIDAAIKALQFRIEEMQTAVKKEENALIVKGGKTISFIEQVQIKAKEYKNRYGISATVSADFREEV